MAIVTMKGEAYNQGYRDACDLIVQLLTRHGQESARVLEGDDSPIVRSIYSCRDLVEKLIKEQRL